MRIRGRSYRRAINIYSIISNVNRARPRCVINIIYGYIIVMRHLPDLLYTWAGYIGYVIIYIGIVNNCCVMDDSNRARRRYIIIINIRPVDISLGCAYPVIIGHMITSAKRYTNAYTRL